MSSTTQIMRIALLAAGLSLLASAAGAQEAIFGKEGVTEISGGVSFSSITPVVSGVSGEAITILSIAPEISHFFSDGFELGFSPGVSLLPGVTVASNANIVVGTPATISVASPSPGNGSTVIQLFALPAYHFHAEGSSVYPYLALPLGYTSASSGNSTMSGISWGLKGGIKVVPASHFLVGIYAEYLSLNFSPANATERSGLNFISFGVAAGGFL